MEIYIDGIGVWGAGIRDWPHAREILATASAFHPESPPLPSPALLPAAERRRSPGTARIAMQVGAEACAMADANPATLPCVFASSHGDTEITDYMCRELAADAPLSPTKFHNSVHNAASGYWTIATGCMRSATALTGGDHSFGTGLAEAGIEAVAGASPVLLVAYDLAAPRPLASVCPITFSFGVALVLNDVQSARSLARLRRLGPDSREDEATLPAGLETLRTGNPAARALPLLSLLARGSAAVLPLPPCCWEIAPCR